MKHARVRTGTGDTKLWKEALQHYGQISKIAGKYEAVSGLAKSDLIQESLLEVYYAFEEGRHRTTTLSLRGFVRFKAKDACIRFIRQNKYPVSITENGYLFGLRLNRGEPSRVPDREWRSAEKACQVVQGKTPDGWGGDAGDFPARSIGVSVDLSDLALDLQEAIRSLAPGDRIILLGYYYPPFYSSEELSREIGIPAWKITRSRRRIIREIRSYLTEEYYQHAAS